LIEGTTLAFSKKVLSCDRVMRVVVNGILGMDKCPAFSWLGYVFLDKGCLLNVSR
jgi:hypothetical protein